MDPSTGEGRNEEIAGKMPNYLQSIAAVFNKEMCTDEEPIVRRKQVQPSSDSGTTKMKDDTEFWPLSGKPLFSVILGKRHVSSPYQLLVPVKMAQELPSAPVPLILRYCGKSWDLVYLGAYKQKRFGSAGWKAFVTDNNLTIGCGCFFELWECSQTKMEFRVQILKTDGLPSPDEDEDGETPENPIIVD